MSQIPTFEAGAKKLSARELNAVAGQARKLLGRKPPPGTNYRISRSHYVEFSTRKRIRRPTAAAGTSGIQQFRVVLVSSTLRDTIICHKWDGTTEDTEDIHVAKPERLRIFPGNPFWLRRGVTILAGSGSVMSVTGAAAPAGETWTINPYWMNGDIIYAHQVGDVLGLIADGSPVTWLEIDSCARQWIWAYQPLIRVGVQTSKLGAVGVTTIFPS